MIKKTFFLVFCFLPVIQLNAGGVDVKPGMWEITTTTSGAMMQPMTKTVKECINEGDMDPDQMLKDMPKDDCSSEVDVEGNVMTFQMSCNMHGMVMEGRGRMESGGNTMQGKIDFKGSMNGMVFEMQSTTTGKRIGDC